MRTEAPNPLEITRPRSRRAAWPSVAGVVLTLALSGAAQAQYEAPPPNAYVAGPTVYPETLPPDPIPEYQPASPGWGFTWVNGYWDWTGYDWTWNNGYWVQGRPGWAYFGPRFIWENGQPVYYRGFWQRPDGYREYRYGGGGMISPAWYARPRYEPRYWRADPGHSTAWRRAPGAPPGGWREAPRIEHRREMEHREGVEHREAEHREMEHREGVEHREAEHHEAEHREAEHHEMGHEGPGGGHGPEMRPAGGPPPAHGAPPAAHPAPAAAPQRGKKK
jgi:hypothetical protein